MSPTLSDYDRSETALEQLRRSGKTLERHQREARQREAQKTADEEQIAEEERERLRENDD